MEKSTQATHAFALYCFLIAIYLSVGGLLQYRFGFLGIALNEVFLLALPGLIYSSLSGHSFEKIFPLNTPALKEVLIVLVLTALVIIPIEMLVQLQEKIWPLPKSIATFYENLVARKTWVDAVLQVFVLALIPAVCEELFFRGLLQSLLTPHFGPLKGILLTGLFFAIAHVNPWYFVYYFFLGIYLGGIRHWKNNLVLCIFAHLLNNLYSLYGQ
jgi:membrane protease YdiL (CAAX protease family)